MARREIKAVTVLVHLEASLHDVMLSIVRDNDDTMSTYFRDLLIRDAIQRGRLTEDLRRVLLGTR